MKQTVILKDIPRQEQACKYIAEAMQCEELHEMVLRPHKSNISIRQQGYYFVVLEEIESYTGKPAEELHLEFKKRFLIPIFCRNYDDHPGFGEMMESLRELWRQGLAKQSKGYYDFVVEKTHLLDAKRDEKAEYLDLIIRAVAVENDIAVTPAEPDIMKRGTKKKPQKG